jgi:hypothetical protein
MRFHQLPIGSRFYCIDQTADDYWIKLSWIDAVYVPGVEREDVSLNRRVILLAVWDPQYFEYDFIT